MTGSGRRARAVTLALGLAAALPLLPVRAPAVTVCAPQPATPGGEWRQMGLDYGHTRNQTAETTIGRVQAATLRPAWTFSADRASGVSDNEITGYPIVADGCVFVGSSRGIGVPGWVFALNADGGDVAWAREADFGPDPQRPGRHLAGGVFSTMAASDVLDAAGNRMVYAYVSRIGAPFVVALDEKTGAAVWATTVDDQSGADAVSSPIVYDGMVWVGVSGTAAESDSTDRFTFRGKSVLLDAVTGGLLASTPVISDEDFNHGLGDAGGAIWSTIAIDPQSRFGFVGTGNPFSYAHENANTNAIVKIDMSRTRDAAHPALGSIVASYSGDSEQYVPDAGTATHCDQNETLSNFLGGFECGHLDLDFGAAPNLFRDDTGTLYVGAGQKSGVYHVLRASDLSLKWKALAGIPSPVGGIVGTAAYDGASLYAPHTVGGYVAALSAKDGAYRWVSPTADGVHWGSPVTLANGVIYTVDFKGFLDAIDSATGAPLAQDPMSLEADTGANPTISWGGVTVARHTVYASVGVGLESTGYGVQMPDGFVIAYRPRRLL